MIQTLELSSILTIVLNFIINFVLLFIKVVITPVNYAFNQLVPNFSDYVVYINNFMDYISDTIGFILSWLNVPHSFILMIITYFVGRMTILFSINIVKIIMNWFSLLKSK